MLAFLRKTVALTLAGLISASPVWAQNSTQNLSYTATAVHTVPGQGTGIGTVIKSGANLRLEYEQGGQITAQILRPAEGVVYILYPADRSYMEFRGPTTDAAALDGPTSPCPEADPSAICQQVGVDKVSGIPVEVWTITAQGQSQGVTVLWDPTRKRALRQTYPDGSGVSLSFKAMDEINGRPAEYWSIRIDMPGAEAQSGGWWFDPELRVALREVLPGGETRSLEDIKIGPVDPSLFTVPTDWRKLEMPGGQGAMPPPAQGGN